MGHQRENTPSGSEVPSLLPSPPSNPCGSPRPTTTKPVHPSSTENASKFAVFLTLYQPDPFSLKAALDLAFQPFNNLFSSSIFLILSLSFLYHIIIIFQRIEKFEQCTQRWSETFDVGGRCRKLVGKQQLL